MIFPIVPILLTISIDCVLCNEAVSKFLRAQCQFPPTVCMGLALKDAKTWNQIQKEENKTTTTKPSVRPTLDESTDHSNPDVYGKKCIKENNCDVGLIVQPGKQSLTLRLFGSAKNVQKVRLMLEYDPFQLDGQLQFDCKPITLVGLRAKKSVSHEHQLSRSTRSNQTDQPDKSLAKRIHPANDSERSESHIAYHLGPLVLANGILNMTFMAQERELPLQLTPTVSAGRSDPPDKLARPIDCIWNMDSRSMMYGFSQFPSTRLYLSLYERRYALRLAASQNDAILYGPAYLVDLKPMRNLLYNVVYKAFLVVNLFTFVLLTLLMGVFHLHGILFFQRMRWKLNERLK